MGAGICFPETNLEGLAGITVENRTWCFNLGAAFNDWTYSAMSDCFATGFVPDDAKVQFNFRRRILFYLKNWNFALYYKNKFNKFKRKSQNLEDPASSTYDTRICCRPTRLTPSSFKYRRIDMLSAQTLLPCTHSFNGRFAWECKRL